MTSTVAAKATAIDRTAASADLEILALDELGKGILRLRAAHDVRRLVLLQIELIQLAHRLLLQHQRQSLYWHLVCNQTRWVVPIIFLPYRLQFWPIDQHLRLQGRARSI